MKKATKKIVSLLTILSFLLTLVPAAVFAADDTTPSTDRSYIEVEDDSVDVNGETNVTVGLRTAKGGDAAVAGYELLVWAGSSSSANDTVVFAGKETPDAVKKLDAVKGVYKVETPVDGVNEMKAMFYKAGSYQLHAALVPTAKLADIEKVSDLQQYRVTENTAAKVTVEASNDIKAIDIMKDGSVIATFTEDMGVNSTAITVKANGLTPTKLKVRAWKDANKTVAADKNTAVTFDTNSANLKLDKTSDKLNYNGEADVELTGDVYGTYKFYVTVGDIDGTLDNVVIENSNAATIEVSKQAKDAFAWDNDFKTKGMEDFVRFTVKDINGNAMKGDFGGKILTNDPGDYIKVLDKPAAMKVEGKDFKVKAVDDKNYYTLISKKELKEGKYSVQVALENGKKAVANFEIGKFGVAKELKIEYNTETVQLNADVEEPSIVFVDKDGIQKKAGKRVSLGYRGYAVDTFDKNDGSFKVKNDEKYLGSKITVTAVAEREGLVAKADLTVAQDGRSIKFMSDKGVVDANNKVEFQLVDGDGKTVGMGADYSSSSVIIENVSDETAKVSASVTETGDLMKKGLGELSLTSNKAVTADVAVYVRDTNGNYYAGNFKYTFGKTASKADTTVVMTIGSKDVIVDNNIVAIDTAALIKNERTFVPYRALAEAFGAKVEWNEKDRTVTTEMDGKKVVMTIDKKEYKVNDKEMTMDVAPYIAKDRTLVPVRFVAEALGFKVTPTYNTDGTTASVVFNK